MLARGGRLPMAKRGVFILARVNRLQHAMQSVEVVVVERRSDVEVSRIEHNAVKHRGDRSGDDIFDLVLVEDLEQCLDIRLLPFHSTPLFLAHPSG
jgi:exosome complex RNA-binding protein Csl4